jgi:hypothetical protein
MTSLSFIECCHRLSIDPKTLRQWLAQAQIPLHPHPKDARIKCLTSEQVHVLANLHGRVLKPEAEAAGASLRPDEAENRMSPAFSDADLRAKLEQMEAQVATLQTQLTNLALQLLQERQHTQQLLLAQQAQFPFTGEQALALLAGPALSVPCQPAMPALVCHPTEKRSRLIPLIEYGARGRYVLICPEAGELHITPDSPEWFAWLASLTSFRFVGQAGCFSARRGYNRRPNRCWYAQRTVHQQYHSKYIGLSEHITTARLEQIAADLQSYMNMR